MIITKQLWQNAGPQIELTITYGKEQNYNLHLKSKKKAILENLQN